MAKITLVIIIFSISINIYAQHSLEFIIPPCPHVNSIEDENKKNVFSIYPNPAGDFFTLELTDNYYDDNIIIEIFNILGKVVKRTDNKEFIVTNKINFNVSDLPEGMYITRLKISNKVHHKKLIIER